MERLVLLSNRLRDWKESREVNGSSIIMTPKGKETHMTCGRESWAHSPSEPGRGGSGTACRGAAVGFSLESSLKTRFSRLKFRNNRAIRPPMLDNFSLTIVNKVYSNWKFYLELEGKRQRHLPVG